MQVEVDRILADLTFYDGLPRQALEQAIAHKNAVIP